MDSLQLLRPHDSVWNDYLTSVSHDFFHTAAYHSLWEGYEGSEAWLAVYGNDRRFLAWPYLVQEIRGVDRCAADLRDITSPYGYTGPLAQNCVDDDDFLARAWYALTELWRSQGGISLFARFHSIYVSETLICAKWMRGNTRGVEGGPCLQGHTIVIDLTRSGREIWNSYRPNLRRDLRRCQRAGLTSAPDPSWVSLDEFARLYYQTMERNRAGAFYFFSVKYFQELQKALGPHGSLLVTRRGNEVAAVGLLFEYNGIATLHLLASDERFSFLSPSKLTIHDAVVWAKFRGNRLPVLGGGRGGNDDDSLFRFKRRFSNCAMLPFYTGRWVLDRDAYDLVAEKWLKQVHPLGSERLTDEYFPVYRMPLTDALKYCQGGPARGPIPPRDANKN